MGGGVGGEKDNLVNWDVVSEDKEQRGFGAPMESERERCPLVCCHQKQVQTTWKWMGSNIVIRESSCCRGRDIYQILHSFSSFCGFGVGNGKQCDFGKFWVRGAAFYKFVPLLYRLS